MKSSGTWKFKTIKFILGSAHFSGKFIPNVSQLCHPLRPLWKKDTNFFGTMNEKHTSNTLKKNVVNSTENTHYNPNFANSIKSDASRAGSDAFVYWKSFFVITDYGTWLSILKKHWSNKSYNSRHTRWVDRLLPFDFNSEHIQDAKRGLVDYISRQPNQKGKDTNNYDEEFAVATITRIHLRNCSYLCKLGTQTLSITAT